MSFRAKFRLELELNLLKFNSTREKFEAKFSSKRVKFDPMSAKFQAKFDLSHELNSNFLCSALFSLKFNLRKERTHAY